jgi:hypothetical protein
MIGPGSHPRALHMLKPVFFLLIFVAVACKKTSPPVVEPPAYPYSYNWPEHKAFTTNYQTFSMPFTADFSAVPAEKGTVQLSEASGLAYSRANVGKIWAHNDSGHPSHLFLIDTATTEIVATFVVAGLANIDWEDMEIAKGPIAGKNYLYVGDTGDNNQRRPFYDVYRFEEPVYDSVQHYGKVNAIDTMAVDRIRFRYPDKSHDTEALFVDPVTLDIYLATKRDVVSMLFVLPYPQTLNSVYNCYHVGDFSFREASAGTVSEDGQRILIKNRQEIFYWQRQSGEQLWQTLARVPVKAPYVGEPQGEAICFDAANNYFTLSEALNQQTPPTLFKYYFNF